LKQSYAKTANSAKRASQKPKKKHIKKKSRLLHTLISTLFSLNDYLCIRIQKTQHNGIPDARNSVDNRPSHAGRTGSAG
jgi:hypothetical protein